jgi:SecD/SecF fusion protein
MEAGWYANIALAVNFTIPLNLASLGAVLTLPGIAGIVLTMGTAVDANIIIYERAKEELRDGKSLDEAVKSSYSWTGAMRSIVDANVTHILIGAVLFILVLDQRFCNYIVNWYCNIIVYFNLIARIFIDKKHW